MKLGMDWMDGMQEPHVENEECTGVGSCENGNAEAVMGSGSLSES